MVSNLPRGAAPHLLGRVLRRPQNIGYRSVSKFNTSAYKIVGVTRDSTGAAIGNCIVDLFYTANDVKASTVQSDASGNFSFSVGPNLACYIVAYLAGSPDIAGTTVNTLIAVAS